MSNIIENTFDMQFVFKKKKKIKTKLNYNEVKNIKLK